MQEYYLNSKFASSIKLNMNDRKLFFEGLKVNGKKFEEILHYMGSKNCHKTQKEIEFFYHTTLHDIRRHIKIWYSKQSETIKLTYKDFYRTYVIDKGKNSVCEIKLMLANEEMKNNGYTTFQKYPNRIISLIKLIKYGQVQIAKNHKKITIKLPSSSIMELESSIRNIKNNHLQRYLTTYPTMIVELRPKNIITAFFMKKLYINSYFLIDIDSNLTIGHLKSKLSQYLNLHRNLPCQSNNNNNNINIDFIHSCERATNCQPFYDNKCDLFGEITKYQSKNNNNNNCYSYNSLQSEIDLSNTYIRESNSDNNIKIKHPIKLYNIIENSFNIKSCGRLLENDEILITLTHCFYHHSGKSMPINLSNNASIFNCRDINYHSSALLYYYFPEFHSQNYYDKLSINVYKMLFRNHQITYINTLKHSTHKNKLSHNNKESVVSKDLSNTNKLNNVSTIMNNSDNSLNQKLSRENTSTSNNDKKTIYPSKILHSELSQWNSSMEMFKLNHVYSNLSNHTTSHHSNNNSISQSTIHFRPLDTRTIRSKYRSPTINNKNNNNNGPSNFAQLASLIKNNHSKNILSNTEQQDNKLLLNHSNNLPNKPHHVSFIPKKRSSSLNEFNKNEDSIDMNKSFKYLINDKK